MKGHRGPPQGQSHCLKIRKPKTQKAQRWCFGDWKALAPRARAGRGPRNRPSPGAQTRIGGEHSSPCAHRPQGLGLPCASTQIFLDHRKVASPAWAHNGPPVRRLRPPRVRADPALGQSDPSAPLSPAGPPPCPRPRPRDGTRGDPAAFPSLPHGSAPWVARRFLTCCGREPPGLGRVRNGAGKPRLQRQTPESPQCPPV